MKQGGITYITDLEDEYGNINELGLGELANRIHAPPILFDKRGTVLYYDDFEDILHGSLTTVGAGIGSLSSDTAKTKGQSLKCVTGFITDGIYLKYYLTDFHTNKIGGAFSFSSDLISRLITCHIIHFDGVNKKDFALSIDLTAKTIGYYDSIGNWISLASNIQYYPHINNWATIKLVVNLDTGLYERAIIYGVEYDMSTLIPLTTPSGLNKHLTYSIHMNNINFSTTTSYIDNVIITGNEPPN